MHQPPEIMKLFRENLWIVLSYVFSKPVIAQVIEEKFQGEWKYLNKLVGEHAEKRADRALLEMATQLRILDDMEDLNGYMQARKHAAFGFVSQADGQKTELHFRDMTNKIVHAAGYEWQLDGVPSVVCLSRDPARWRYAEIEILSLMTLGGMLGG